MQLYSVGAAQVGQIGIDLNIRRVRSLSICAVFSGGGLKRAKGCNQRFPTSLLRIDDSESSNAKLSFSRLLRHVDPHTTHQQLS